MKILEKYKKMPVELRASLWFTICSFMQKGISMITTPIFTRFMDTTEYGRVSVFMTWETLMLLIVSLSLYKSLMNLYVKSDERLKTTTSVMGLSILITGSALVLVIAFPKFFSKILGISSGLVVALFAYIVVTGCINCWMVYKRYMFDYKPVVAFSLLSTGVTAFISIILVVFVTPTAEARIFSTVAVTVIFGGAIIVKTLLNGKTLYQKDVWCFSLSFCICLMPHYLSEFVLSSSDKLMINSMCGASDVALYSVAYTVGSLITLITNAINTSFAPYQYQRLKDKNYKELEKTATVVLSIVAIMLMIIMLFGKEIIYIFGGNKYKESYLVIMPICIGIYFNYIFQLFARVQEYYERKVTVVIPSILCAVLNLILNYFGIKLFGYQAAAYTTFICYMIFCFVHYLFYVKVCRTEQNGEQIYNVKEIGLLSLVVIISGIVAQVLNVFGLLWAKIVFVLVTIIICMMKKKVLISLFEKMRKG